MAIRLIENKEPVMIIGGHRNQWDDNELFWRIDECADPNQCEYIDFKIDDKSIVCIIVRRKGVVYVINKKNPKYKQRQG